MTPEKRISQMPTIHDGLYIRKYKKAMEGNSLRCAVDSFCLECNGWERIYVKSCTDTGCPLYPYRPYKDTGRPSGALNDTESSTTEDLE